MGFRVIQSKFGLCWVADEPKETVICNASQFRFSNSIMTDHYLLMMLIKMKKTEISSARAALAAFCSLCLFSGGAFAADPPVTQRLVAFDLPAQSLQSGLVEFAIQAKVSILVDHQLIQGYKSAPLAGPQKAEAALEKLLANTPLEYKRQTATGAYIIQAKMPVIEPQAESAPPVEIDAIEEVLVTSSLPFRYQTVANSQIEGGIAYFDSSRFINTIPSQLLRDQQPQQLMDAIKYASGITPGDGLADSNDDMFIRGFQRHAVYLDGFRLSEYTGIKLSPLNVEEVNILKGPSTLLYGQAEPGGIINVIRKRPQDETFVRASVGGGSFGRRSIDGDINIASAFDENLHFRLVTALDERDTSGEIRNLHQELIAPSVNWQLSNSTSIDAGYEFQYSQQEASRDFLVLNPTGPFEGATMEQLTRQARPEFSAESRLYHVQLNHYFADDWRVSAKYVWQGEDRLGIRTSGETLNTTNVLLDREALGNDFYLLTLGGQLAIPLILYPQFADMQFSLGPLRSLFDEEAEEFLNNARVAVDGSFETGELIHHVNLGVDWYQQDIYKKYQVETRRLLTGQYWPLTELDFGGYEIIKAILASRDIPGEMSSIEQRLLYDDYGVFFQDNIELGDFWSMTLGTRYASIQGEYTDITNDELTQLQTYNRFSSQAGLVFKPTENYSLFVNYSESLRANYHIDDIGSRLADPEMSDQWEIGVKSRLWDGKLMSSLALFDINKHNIVDIKVIEGYKTSLEAHEQSTRGIDFDFTWQAASALNVMGAFSLTHAEVLSGENAGLVPDLVAEQTASLFVNYKVLHNVEVNAGLSYIGERMNYAVGSGLDGVENLGDDFFVLNPYTLMDLGLTYYIDWGDSTHKFQLLVNNATDENYFTTILGGTRFNPGNGRTLYARLEFSL